MSSINDLMELSQAPSIESFRGQMLQLAHGMEFGLFQVALIAAPPGQAPSIAECSEAPAGWVPTDHAHEIHRDPVIKRLKTLSTPFLYDPDVYAQDGAGDLWDTQAPYGYHSGIAVALHLPGFRHFTLGLSRDKPLPKDDHKLARLFADVQLMAVYAQIAGQRLLTTSIDGQRPDLSERELEVLRLARDGKSAWIAGQILSISERTVKAHLERIYAKLAVNSKNQAILKAHELGLI